GRCVRRRRAAPRAGSPDGRSRRRRSRARPRHPVPSRPTSRPYSTGAEMDVDREKKLAAEAAAELVEDGMRVGLGTGSTVAFLLEALAARDLHLRYVATSRGTEEAARSLGLDVEPFESLDRLDIAIDGADQIAPDGWLVK